MTYTAEMTAFLVVERKAEGSILDVKTAISRGVKVCVPRAIKDVIDSMYPGVLLVEMDNTEDGPRLIHGGKCGAAVLSEIVVSSLHSGKLKEADCKKVKTGKMAEEEGRCELGLAGRVRDDCGLIKVT